MVALLWLALGGYLTDQVVRSTAFSSFMWKQPSNPSVVTAEDQQVLFLPLHGLHERNIRLDEWNSNPNRILLGDDWQPLHFDAFVNDYVAENLQAINKKWSARKQRTATETKGWNSAVANFEFDPSVCLALDDCNSSSDVLNREFTVYLRYYLSVVCAGYLGSFGQQHLCHHRV